MHGIKEHIRYDIVLEIPGPDYINSDGLRESILELIKEEYGLPVQKLEVEYFNSYRVDGGKCRKLE